MLLTFADVSTGVNLSDAMPALSSIGSLGFAIWFAYYTTTTTLPAQQKEHRDLIERITATHADTIRELVAEMRSGRESYDRWRSSQQH